MKIDVSGLGEVKHGRKINGSNYLGSQFSNDVRDYILGISKYNPLAVGTEMETGKESTDEERERAS